MSEYNCLYCAKEMAQPTESHCCSTLCEQMVVARKREHLDEMLDDRLAEAKFLRPINPDPVRTMAKELKRKI